MGQKSEPAAFNQLFAIGLDSSGNPRGARFSVLKDSIVSAAMDMNLQILMYQPPDVTSFSMRLPVGHVYGTGKVVTLFVPNIPEVLYRQVVEAVAVAGSRNRLPANHMSTNHREFVR